MKDSSAQEIIFIPKLSDYVSRLGLLNLPNNQHVEAYSIVETLYGEFQKVLEQKNKKILKLIDRNRDLLRIVASDNDNPSSIEYQNEIDQLKDDNIKLNEEIQLDQLTRLLNHKAFMGKLKDTLAKDQRQRHCAVLFTDIRRLKEINDNLGHSIGTDVIIEVSRILSNHRNPTNDLLARYGGDEFVIFIDNLKNIHELEIIGMRILEEMRSLDQKTLGIKGPLKIDIGAIYFELKWNQQRESSAERLLKQLIIASDNLMYRAKHYKGIKKTSPFLWTTLELIEERDGENKYLSFIESSQKHLSQAASIQAMVNP